MAKKEKTLPKGIRQKNGTYEARFMIEGITYYAYGHTVEEAQKAADDIRYEVGHGLYIKETKIRVNEWFDTWMKEYKENTVKYGTYNCYQSVFDHYIKEAIGSRLLSEIRPDHIQRVYNNLVKDGYSHKTISLTAIILGGMFKQAYKNQMIAKNPAELATIPRNTKKKKEISVMTKDQQAVFIEYAKDSAYSHLYTVALGTGMRVGELRALEWSDIDYQKNVIHVNGTLKYCKGKGYFKDTPKTATSCRDIPMIPEVVKALKEQRSEQTRQRLELGTMWNPEKGMDNFVFTGYYTYHGFGKNLCSNAINHDLSKVEEQIKIKYPDFPHITPHTLRHTFATRGLENGIPPKVMQTILGHTSITMTLDIYSHVLPNTAAAEIMKVSGMF